MNYLLKTFLIVILIILFTGCEFENLNTYSSNQYTFQYPNTYSVEKPSESFPVLVIKTEDGRIEIFKHKDFNDPLSLAPNERTHGYSSSGAEEFEAKLVPKEKLKIDDYDVWLFYLKSDEQTKQEIQKIFKSIKTQ